MSDTHDKTFDQCRSETFDAVIALIEKRVAAISPSLLLRPDELSEESLRQNAERESWSLFSRGIRHLKDGAPDNRPGSVTEALSRMSLRSSPFAAALGVKPPQFEQIYFSVNYTTGYEAALFFCRRLIDAAEGDLSKSKQIIHQKMITEKQAAAFGSNTEALKRHMAFSFNVLVETYSLACRDFREALSSLVPVAAPGYTGKTKSPKP